MGSDDQQPVQVIAPAPTLLHRALKIQPLKQGQLDGLCGVYAGINALRLLLAADRPLLASETKTLFRVGIKKLVKRERLASAVLGGMPDNTWRKLLVKLAGSATAITGRAVAVTHPLQDRPRASRRELFSVIEAAVDARQPVLLSLSGKHDHYTVICGYTAQRFLQYDSGPLSWLSRDLCGPSNSRREWRHEIVAASLTVLSLGGGQPVQTNS